MSDPSLAEFRTLFEGNRDAVFRFLHRLTRNAADAEDLLQETFMAVWRHRDQFEGRGSEAGWIRRIAYRRFLNLRTKRTRRERLAPTVQGLGTPDGPRPAAHPGPSPADLEAKALLLERVHAAIEALPEEQRDAFRLFRADGLTCREIAEATDTPVKTVETRVRRATLRLAERLAPYRDLLPAGGTP